MKLEEAADILGVAQTADLATLRQAYRKMAIGFHPDKFTDSASREKFQMMSLAYTKLISSKRQDEDEYDSDEENDYTEEDVHEMRAFMRMFMDLVGIFSDEQVPSQDVHTSTGIPFGMSNVGSLPVDAAEEWSTEDEDDMDDDESDGCEDADDGIFEPMAKSYYHMNLKEAAGQERGMHDRESEEEAKRKLKNAKKKMEKRRKQKEKKQKEAAEKEEEEEKSRAKEEEARLQQEELARQRKEEIRKAHELEASRRAKLFADAAAGNLAEIVLVLDNTVLKCTERVNDGGKSGAGLVHYAVLPPDATEADIAISRDARLEVASYLLRQKSPAIDLSVLDEAGCNVLHLAAKSGNIKFMDMILHVRGESHERRNQLDLNGHCLNFGYTALHYATEGGHFEVCNKLIDIGVLLNVHAAYMPGSSTAASEGAEQKGPTPLDLANGKMAAGGLSGSKKDEYRKIIEKLSNALAKIESARLAREQERQAKEAKLKAEKEALLLKAQEEKELLDRKQRQLQEKQQKIAKLRETAESSTAAAESTAHVTNDSAQVSSKKKKKEKKKSVDKKNNSTEVAAVSSLDSLSLKVHENQQARPAPSQRPRSESTSSTGSAPARAPIVSAPALQPEEMNSRGELMNHLLAMGFPEDQCSAAISACGLNADLAITWIVDRPEPAAPARQTNKPANAKSAASEAAGRSEAELREKAQREKEKLRRINREWNAKVPQQRAEEERRKAQQEKESQLEAERKKMASMLAPHLKFPPDVYGQGVDPAYNQGMGYAPGMPPPPGQYGVAPTYSYGGPPYMQPQQYMAGPSVHQPPPFLPSKQGGRSNGPSGAPQTSTAAALPQEAGAPYPSPSRMQSWPPVGASAGTTGPFPPAPGLPLAPSVNLTPVKSAPNSYSTSSGAPQYPASNVVPSPPGAGVAYGGTSTRSRGPPSPSLSVGNAGFDAPPSQGFGSGYSSSPELVSSGSPVPSDNEPRYIDGALELSVQAREFVPKFAPSQGGSNPPHGGASGGSQQSSLLGLWNGGSGGSDDVIKDSAEMAAPPLLFPSDLGGSGVMGGGGMGFDALRSWGLSDSMDLQIPLQGGGLGLTGSLGGGLHGAFGNDDDEADLDMDAAMLGNDILGNLDDSELTSSSGRGQRKSSSFLASFGGLQEADLDSSSSGFSSIFDRNRDK